MQRTVAGRAVRFGDGNIVNIYDRPWNDAALLIGVENTVLVVHFAQRNVYNNIDRLRLTGVGVGNNDDFLIIQNPGPCEHLAWRGRDSKGASVLGNRAEIEAAITKGWFGIAHARDLLDLLVERRVLRKSWSNAPQSLPHGGIGAAAVQTLLRAIIKAGNAWQRIETGNSESHLIIESILIASLNVPDPLFHIVIIQECDEEAGCISVRA